MRHCGVACLSDVVKIMAVNFIIFTLHAALRQKADAMGQVIRWGILGTGKIAKAFALALKETPDAELVAIASRTEDSANRFGAEFGVARCHGSYQALADDDQVDVIYI